MSSRFDRPSNSSSRANRGKSRGKFNGEETSFGRPSKGKRSGRARNPYRENIQLNEDRKNSSSSGRYDQNRIARDRIDQRPEFKEDSRSSSFRDRSRGQRPHLTNEARGRSRTSYVQKSTSNIRNTNNVSKLEGIPYSSDEDRSSLDRESFSRDLPSDIIWGRHATQSALEAGRPIHRIWCTSDLRSSHRFLQLLRDAKSSGVLVEEVTWARLGHITSGAVHQGIVIQIAAADTLDLPRLMEGCKSLDEPPLLLALDGVTDPQNLGAIVRSAEAFGAHGLVLPQRRSAGLTGSVAKVAAGALEHLPVARVVNLNRSLEELKKSGYRVVGLAEDGDLTVQEADLEGPLVVVTGSEGKGISLVTRRHCDQLVRIPLRGVTTSLNASVATAVFLYEVARCGWMKGLSGQAPSPRMVRAQYASSTEKFNEFN